MLDVRSSQLTTKQPLSNARFLESRDVIVVVDFVRVTKVVSLVRLHFL